MYNVWSYAAYLAISLAITIWVALTLHKNGRIFLIEAFRSNAELADSVNHLLLVGFYLINIGFITLTLRTGVNLASLRESVELLSDKIGMVLVILGIMHFTNLYIFSQMRKRAQAGAESPPFSPDAFVPTAPQA
jgi:hypothetical protein